jgi:hypothetical protein
MVREKGAKIMSIRVSALMRLLCAILAIVVLSAPAYSQKNLPQVERDKRTEFEIRYWFTNSRARYNWRFTGRHKLKIDYAQLSTNSGAADIALNPGGSDSLSVNNIDLDSLRRAEVDIKQLKIGYSWQGIKLGNRIRLGPLVDVH